MIYSQRIFGHRISIDVFDQKDWARLHNNQFEKHHLQRRRYVPWAYR